MKPIAAAAATATAAAALPVLGCRSRILLGGEVVPIIWQQAACHLPAAASPCNWAECAARQELVLLLVVHFPTCAVLLLLLQLLLIDTCRLVLVLVLHLLPDLAKKHFVMLVKHDSDRFHPFRPPFVMIQDAGGVFAVTPGASGSRAASVTAGTVGVDMTIKAQREPWGHYNMGLSCAYTRTVARDLRGHVMRLGTGRSIEAS